MKKKIITFFLVFSLAFGLVASGCGKKEDYAGNVVHYASSDQKLADFLNDFTHRNLRYDDYSIADPSMQLGNGTGFAKNWETMSLVWHNCAGTALGNDKLSLLRKFLSSITQDDYGMIYNSHNNFLIGSSVEGDGIPQGWPFPTSKNSGGRATSFEFNYSSEAQKWQTSAGSAFSVSSDGYGRFTYSAPAADGVYRMTYENIAAVTTGSDGIDTKHAPFVEIDLRYVDRNGAIGTATDVADIYLVWQTESGGDTWFEAAQSDYTTSPVSLTYAYAARSYWPMYLHPDWDGQVVTALGLEIRPKEGKTLDLTDGQINYIRTGYDTRQSNSTYQFILALGNYIAYTNDNEYLAEILPKARKALLFLTHALQGEEGLLDISFLYGHNGIGAVSTDSGMKKNVGDGLGNGYWDILTAPEKNLEANTYYYQALRTMANLERRAAAAGVSAENPTAKNRAIGGDRVAYAYDAAALDALAETVNANVQKEIKPTAQPDGTYTNEGGFWNPATGRFASGIRKDNGAVIDYGFVYWNEEALAAGLGSQSQRKSVMDWIGGTRSVDGDNSTGEDIYFYEFAPRFSTVKNVYDYGFYFTSPGYSLQVQDGGAIICWSYYDLMSRIAVNGADDAFSRLKGIQRWYEDVQSAGGEGTNFYNDYYMYKETGSGVYVMQQSGVSNGAIGLDTEFLESILLHSAVPFGFFGMDANEYNTVSFTNNLPSALKHLQIDNMLYGGVTYSVRMEKGGLAVKNVKGDVPAGYTLKLNFKEPAGKYTVKVNGKATSDYAVSGGVVTVTVPFGNVGVTVK